jgi:hypothetical protein
MMRRCLIVCLSWFVAGGFAHASKRILVDLTHQIAIAYQDGEVKFYGRISSGKPGRETPTGSFRVLEKDIDHVSNLWPKPNGGAKMHYMLRITRDGIAMHLGPTPDYPASHGCIRMQDGFAQRMFAWAEKYTSVDIVGKAPAHSPAVALPAYARSPKILRRSIGGGNHGPLAAISSNPKDHVSHETLSIVTPEATKRESPRTKRLRHPNPLAVVSGNPKAKRHHISKKRNTKRRKHRRKKRSHRQSRHMDPLKAVSGRGI